MPMTWTAVSVDITPVDTVALGGYLQTRRTATVAETIEANCVVARDAGGVVTVLISVDLLYVGRRLRALVEAGLPHIPAERVFFAASHTHYGPMTDDTKPLIGQPNPAYEEYAAGLIVSAVRGLPGDVDQSEMTLSVATGNGWHSINRRRKRLINFRPKLSWNAMMMAPNPRGSTDEQITVAVAHEKRESPPAFVIWNYACHPVGFPDANAVAAHFPSVVRERVREYYLMPTLPILFFQGFSGDVRPSISVGKPTGAKGWLLRLIDGPAFIRPSAEAYQVWARDLGLRVLTLAGEARPVPVEAVTVSRAQAPSSDFVLGASHPVVTFHAIRLGSKLSIVGASAEVVSGFSASIRAEAHTPYVMCVGCIDHTFGYAPTRQMLDEGGYEAADYCVAFGLSGVAPGVAEALSNGFTSVLRSNAPSQGESR